MADHTGLVRADEQLLHLTPTSQTSSQPPYRIVVSRQQPPAATVFRLPSHIEDHIQVLCPKCGTRLGHDHLLSGREIAAVEVKEEKPDSVCDVCGHELVAAYPLRGDTATHNEETAIEFVNVHEPSGKLDEATGTHVRAHLMRQYHQSRRKSQGKPAKASRIIRKDRQTPRTCACPHQEICKTRDFQDTGLMTVLGFGRSDPFLSLSVPNVPQRYHELVDYCVTVLWPGLRGFDYSVAYAREWLPIASKNAVVLNVFLFTASLHLETLRGPGSLSRKKIRTEQLSHKGKAISGINEALLDPKYCQSDELIQNILFLAMNETGEEEESADPSPFTPPLQNVQWLGVYGTRKYVMLHVNAVQDIIRRRGGIRNIKTVGLPWLISFSELIYCAATLDKPQHPLLDPFGRDIAYQPLNTSSDASSHNQKSGQSKQGFHYLHSSGMRQEVIDVFLKLKDYSEAVDAYSQCAILPDCMADNRSWVLHRLLSLPSVGASALGQINLLSEDFHSAMLCFEACRLTAIMYCIHVTFPVPRSLYARQLLLPQMRESIGKVQLVVGNQAPTELLLWCVVVGGVAASSQPERSWFATQLFHLARFLDLTKWSDAKMVLRKFAWLDSACEKGGAAFWNEVL